MLLDFLPIVLGIYLLILFAFIVWESAVIVQDKKERQQKGLTDYYDNTIEKDNA